MRQICVQLNLFTEQFSLIYHMRLYVKLGRGTFEITNQRIIGMNQWITERYLLSLSSAVNYAHGLSYLCRFGYFLNVKWLSRNTMRFFKRETIIGLPSCKIRNYWKDRTTNLFFSKLEFEHRAQIFFQTTVHLDHRLAISVEVIFTRLFELLLNLLSMKRVFSNAISEDYSTSTQYFEYYQLRFDKRIEVTFNHSCIFPFIIAFTQKKGFH